MGHQSQHESSKKGLNGGKCSRLRENIQIKREIQRDIYSHRRKSETTYKIKQAGLRESIEEPQRKAFVQLSAQQNEKRPQKVE